MRTKPGFIYLFFLSIILLPVFIFVGFRYVEDHIEPLPYYRNAGLIDENTGSHYQIPGFSFLSQDSLIVNQDILKGKIGLINYFFTACPSICPKIMENLNKLNKISDIQNHIKILSLTVDPVHDSSQKLKNYAFKRAIQAANWELLTGKKIELYRFARKGLFLTANDGDGGKGDFIHSEKITLIDYDRHIRGYYDGTDPNDMKKLLSDIKKLSNMESPEDIKLTITR